MFSEARARLFSLGLDKEKATCGTGQDEMSDGRKCFQQLLLQWVEHVQSIAKQIKKIKKAAGNLNDKNHSGLDHNHTSQRSSAAARSKNTVELCLKNTLAAGRIM